MVCPALRPRPCPRTSHCGPRISLPLSQRRKPPGISFISWLNNTAFHLAVYASCRPLRRRCKTRLQCDATRFPAVFVPLGRRCGVSRPVAVPRLSPFDQFFCLCHSVLFFLVSVFGAFPAAMPFTAPGDSKWVRSNLNPVVCVSFKVAGWPCEQEQEQEQEQEWQILLLLLLLLCIQLP